MVKDLLGQKLTLPEKIVYAWYRDAANEAGKRLAEVIRLRQRCAVLESAGTTFDERTRRMAALVEDQRLTIQYFKAENDRLRRFTGPDGREFTVR